MQQKNCWLAWGGAGWLAIVPRTKESKTDGMKINNDLLGQNQLVITRTAQ
jgi:hypothetical protein